MEASSSRFLPLYKGIILYMLERAKKPLSRAQIMDFVLGYGYTNFMTFQEAMGELLEQELIEEARKEKSPGRTFVKLTKTGEQTLHYYRDHISKGAIGHVEAFLKENHLRITNENAIRTDYHRTSFRTYEVTLGIREKDRDLTSITIEAPTEKDAIAACDTFRNDCEQIYRYLLEKLFSN